MNKWLKGNGHWCPKCGGTGRGKPLDALEWESGAITQFYAKCQHCNGERRLPGPGQDTPEPTCGLMNQCMEHIPPPTPPIHEER